MEGHRPGRRLPEARGYRHPDCRFADGWTSRRRTLLGLAWPTRRAASAFSTLSTWRHISDENYVASRAASPSQCDMFPSQGREMGKGVIGGCSPNGARVLTARSRHPAAGRGHPGGKVTKLPNLARRGPILSSRPHSTSLARYPPIRLAAYPPSAALGRRHRRTASPAPAGADRGRGGRRGRGAADHLVARRGWQGGHRGVHPTARALTSNGRSQR